MTSSSSEVVQLLRRQWLNEMFAPELLPYQNGLIEDIQQILQQQESMLQSVQSEANGSAMKPMLLEMEMERVRYLLREYYRIRLAKIEKYFLHIIDTELDNTPDLLSEAEKKYCNRYADLWGKHAEQSALDKLPENLRILHAPEMITKPNLERYVICHVLKDLGEIQLNPSDTDSDEVIMMNKSDILLIRYDYIRLLLLDNKLELR